MAWDGIERRIERRKDGRLHETDIEKIVVGVSDSLSPHICRFGDITTKDIQSAVDFTLKFKGIAEQTGMWVWKIIIGLIVTGGAGLTALGFWNKTRGK